MGRASFHRLAERELYDAVQYYDLESPGLGAAFRSEVDRCVQTILRYPKAGPVILGAVRRRLVLRFPYGILYPSSPTACESWRL